MLGPDGPEKADRERTKRIVMKGEPRVTAIRNGREDMLTNFSTKII